MFYVKVNIANSQPGMGKGVFAAQPIKKGQKVFTLDGPYITRAEAEALGRVDHAMPVGPNLYANMELENTVNHSCQANLGYVDGITAVANRDIASGEELTWDFSVLTVDDWSMQCLCGLPDCRKIIGNFADLPLTIQKKLAPFTPSWVLAYVAAQENGG